MPEIYKHVLGCKVNFADIEEIVDSVPVPKFPAALVGTCCVTAEGQKQSRKEVGRAARRVGPGGKVFVAGCAARLNPEEFESIAENVVVLTCEVQDAARQISGVLAAGDGSEALDGPATVQFSKDEAGPNGRTRFFLKIQDGCANGCTYCVIPQVRGGPRSVPVAEVLERARGALGGGYPELVATGINVGAFRDGAYGLPQLLEDLAKISGLGRLRLSSLEINHVTEDLLEVIARNEVIGRHLHLPLQSGDDAVLTAMGRRYGREEYARAVAMVRRTLPDINLTTDVIVGFPAEGEAAFANTLALVEEIGFSRVNVFSYSPRPGTEAMASGDPVPPEEKKRRSRMMRELSGRLQSAHLERKMGTLSEVLLESEQDPGVHGGYGSDYTRFLVEGGRAGSFVKVRARAVTEHGLWGKMESDD